MKMFRHLSSVFAIATIAPLALAATLAVTPAIAQADQLPNPDWVALLSDYEKNYWQAPTDAEHGGKVLDADTMKLDEDLAVAINHKAAENLDKDGLNAQRKRALVDSDLQAEEAMPDALGPVLGKYMSEGLKSGKLNAVADIFSFNVVSTYASKRAAMHPRPYLNRAESSYGGTNDLAGLPATLDIKQSPSWLEHVPGYSNLQKNSSYPFGHTTGAYSWGIALAGMIPELAPQIMARTSEAGNNRIVLGVHYPLDIMGGRIGASAQNGQYWHNEFASSIVPRPGSCATIWCPAAPRTATALPSPPASPTPRPPVRAATPTIFWTSGHRAGRGPSLGRARLHRTPDLHLPARHRPVRR